MVRKIYLGETADTLNALRYCHSARARIIGVTNTVGSSLSKESDCGIHINAGPEIGVASTKAYTSQFISLVMFALVMSEDSYKKQERRKQVYYKYAFSNLSAINSCLSLYCNHSWTYVIS